MSCTQCGAELPENAAACPTCGMPVDNAADRASRALGDAAASLKQHAARRADDLAGRIPGRSLAVAGYAVLLGAILLELVPGRHGGAHTVFGWGASRLGHVWDVALAAATIAAAYRRLTTQVTDTALPAAIAALTAAQAYLVLDPSLVPLLVLVAAVILVYDAVRTGLARTTVETTRRALDRIPNRTTTGIAIVVASLLVSWFPGRPHSLLNGVLTIGSDVTGTAWGVLLLAGAAAATAVDRRTEWWAPWYVGGYVLVLVAWAVLLFNLSLVPLLWLAGATIAAYDQWTRARNRTDQELTLTRLTRGPRRLIAAGVPVCLVAMSFTWTHLTSAGFFGGGYESTYSSYEGGYVGSYNPIKYYYPGFSFTGSGFHTGPATFNLSPIVVALLLALLVAAVWVQRRPVPAWGYVVPAAMTAVVALWLVVRLDGEWGPWLFAAGLALTAVATVTAALPHVRALTRPATLPDGGPHRTD